MGRAWGQLSDRDLLYALEARAAGVPVSRIAAAKGVKYTTLFQALARIDRETEPSKHDGTMPAGWWR